VAGRFSGPWFPLTPIAEFPRCPNALFYISDGTGITAETFGNALMAGSAGHVIRLPFVDSVDEAYRCCFRSTTQHTGRRPPPIVFTTLADMEIVAVIRTTATACCWTSACLSNRWRPSWASSPTTRSRTGCVQSKAYDSTETVDFSLIDDSQSSKDGGLRRDSGGVSPQQQNPIDLPGHAAWKQRQLPADPEDFDRRQCRPRWWGTAEDFRPDGAPERLSQIRNERQPNSVYTRPTAAMMHEAEAMMRREGIHWLSTTRVD
jgi:regulator of PEP synthase PpsR (kinase-PPPase family)